MRKAIVGDTETTDFPKWKIPSDDPTQPHLVQLAAHQVDLDTQTIIQSMDVIVRPDGWLFDNQEAADEHGITFEHAMDVGISEKLAVEMLFDLWGNSHRIFHNTTFDNRMIRIALKRYFPEELQLAWKEGSYECTMMKSKKYANGTLSERYKTLIGEDLVNAHSAMADTNACWELYKFIKTREEVAA